MNSNTFEFRGPPTNLGRFGMVKAGDVLVLTDREAHCIRDDKRFKPVTAELKPETQREIARLNIEEMNREQLIEYCTALKEVDPEFQFRRDWDHVKLLMVVRRRLEQQSKNPA